MWLKHSEDTFAELYCEEHSNLINPLSEGQHYFDNEIKVNSSILKSLERLLIVVQEQMEYSASNNTNKDFKECKRVKDELDQEYFSLKNTLNETTLRANQITIIKEMKTAKNSWYEDLSFIKFGYEKWLQNILQILRLIFEANIKSEIEAKLKTILNWSGGIEQYEDEAKSNSVYSVPNEIYGEEFQLCKIPTQTLKKIKELEIDIQNIAKISSIHQKVKIIL